MNYHPISYPRQIAALRPDSRVENVVEKSIGSDSIGIALYKSIIEHLQLGRLHHDVLVVGIVNDLLGISRSSDQELNTL